MNKNKKKSLIKGVNQWYREWSMVILNDHILLWYYL